MNRRDLIASFLFLLLFSPLLVAQEERSSSSSSEEQESKNQEWQAVPADAIEIHIKAVPGNGDNAGKLALSAGGVHFKDVAQLRAWLRTRANPRLHPDRKKGEVGKLDGKSLYPSAKTLVIVSDPLQPFGWTMATLQACTFFPGEDTERALVTSPLIYRTAFRVNGAPRTVVNYLPVDKGLSSAAARTVREITLVLTVPAKSPKAKGALGQRDIVVSMRQANVGEFIEEESEDESEKKVEPTVLGRITGIEVKDGKARFTCVPKDLMSKVTARMKALRAQHKKCRVKLNARPVVPFAAAHAMLRLVEDTGFPAASISGIPNHLIRDLVAGKIR